MNRRDECLILIADDEEPLCELLSQAFTRKGYKTAIAHNGREALDLVTKLDPDLAVVDLRMPVMGGMEFLDEMRRGRRTTSVIITTGYPDVETAIASIRNGAYDYLVKPISIELLEQKVAQALHAGKLARENVLLSELASLHDTTRRLSNTHTLPDLLEVTLQCCMESAQADSGSIQLLDKKANELVIVHQRGLTAPQLRTQLGDSSENTVSKWVFKRGRSLLVAGDKQYPAIDMDLHRADVGSSISVPLRSMDETIGVLNLNRKPTKDPFSVVHLNTIDVLAAQAGIAINNANLYSSVHQKLAEVSLISNYSEQLMGLMDKEDIIRCLFETVEKYFTVDFIGYLGASKRNYEFLFWSRGVISNENLETILGELAESYGATTKTKIPRKKITMHKLSARVTSGGRVTLPFMFRHTTRLTVEDVDFGMLFFGSARGLENEIEKISLLSSLINQTRIALTNSRLYSDMKENYIRTIKALAIAVDAKDTYTHGHSENVMNIAEEIAREMSMDQRAIGIIRDSALLHDIGKIGIPGTILNKPGALTYEEFNGIMKSHAALGANIVKDVPFLRDLYELILYHHEHYDGSGYPKGLKDGEIPLGARVLHVADAFEAMTSNRPYRTSLGRDEAFRRLEQERGKQFDPEVVDAFFKIAQRKGWRTK